MQQSESIAGLAAALVQFQGQVEGAKKTAVNPHLKNKYADLASIWEAIREPLSAAGLSVVQLPAPSDAGTLKLRTRLIHASGEWLESEIQMPLAKSDPQGYGSALTYARRYSLAAMLGIIQEDDDGEAAMKRPDRSASERARHATPADDTDEKAEKAKTIKRAMAATNLSSDTVIAMASRMFKGRAISTSADVVAKLSVDEIAQLAAEMASPITA